MNLVGKSKRQKLFFKIQPKVSNKGQSLTCHLSDVFLKIAFFEKS